MLGSRVRTTDGAENSGQFAVHSDCRYRWTSSKLRSCLALDDITKTKRQSSSTPATLHLLAEDSEVDGTHSNSKGTEEIPCMMSFQKA